MCEEEGTGGTRNMVIRSLVESSVDIDIDKEAFAHVDKDSG